MYEINTRKTTQGKVEFRLNSFAAGRPPKAVILGVGDRAARYNKHLETCFSKNTELLRLLAWIHLQGSKNGNVDLIADKSQPWHAACVKGFIEKNREFLTTVVPYLFPGEKIGSVEPPVELSEELQAEFKAKGYEKFESVNTGAKTLADLPEDDRNQILVLIQADQASQGVQQQDAPVIPITVGDESQEGTPLEVGTQQN